MLAGRADEIFRKNISFVNISTDLAYPALFHRLRLRLYVALIIAVRHGFGIGYLLCFGYVTNEHTVRTEIDFLLYRKRHKRIYVLRQINKSVRGTRCSLAALTEFICSPAALEPEVPEYRERSLRTETVYIERLCIMHCFIAVVSLVDANSNPQRIIRNL